MNLQGKHIIVGITGSIAAYKSCELIRLFIKAGAEVQVVITPAGKEFITPLTLSTLSSNPVISEFFSNRDGSWNSHVALGLWADAFVIAPATASTVGKMAHGIADNMLLTTYLSMRAPVFVAPAMDMDMYAHPTTQENLKILKANGNQIIEPGEGFLASKLIGKGRMEEPENIFRVVASYLCNVQDLAGKRILITAGPTREKIDPVRYISNFSTGKMGYALAEECANRGAEVVLVSGPSTLKPQHPHIQLVNVESAAEMHESATQEFQSCWAAILCAAVADFTPATQANQKIKRNGDELSLSLVPTQDIAAQLGKMRKEGQHLVGFALETEHETDNAKQKLEKKNLDFIVLNSLQDKGAGFACDTNKITIISRQGEQKFDLKPKTEVAKDIIDNLCAIG